MKSILIIGANSAIAKAIAERAVAAEGYDNITLISSRPIESKGEKFTSRLCGHNEREIKECASKLRFAHSNLSVFICNGILHNDQFYPEKKAEEITPESMMALFEANTIIPSMWLKHLLPIVEQTAQTKITVFSARVGSIADNKFGGWYSYRASKAALNMMIKTFSVEYFRKQKYSKLIAFHPGMTDSPLSKPFQKSARYALFQPDFVAEQALSITEEAVCDGEALYLDWQGEPIEW